jgi:hypothetical protein
MEDWSPRGGQAKPMRSLADCAADRRISVRLFALPVHVERAIGGHLFLGGGVDGERRLHEALAGLPADLRAALVALAALEG